MNCELIYNPKTVDESLIYRYNDYTILYLQLELTNSCRLALLLYVMLFFPSVEMVRKGIHRDEDWMH